MTPPSTPPRALLDERSLAEVLLVRAVEEADREGALLTRAERERAGARAAACLPRERDPAPDETAAFLRERARELAQLVDERAPLLRRLRAARARLPLPLVLGGLAALGLASHLVGEQKRIHVLANPLMTLLVWNLAVYALLLAHALRARRAEGGLAARLGGGGWLARGLRALGRDEGAGDAIAREALARAAGDLARTAAPLYAARGRRLLHLGSMALALGALGGLYLRGLVLEYRAVWESTFLSQATTERALGALFAPASLLSGIRVPALEPGGGPAAAWIHLYAISVGLFVLVPRSLLAWHEGRGARALARGLPLALEGPTFARLAGAHRGQGVSAHLAPYGYRPDARARERLIALLHDVFGARTRVQAHEELAYGAEASELLAQLGAEGGRVVPCFALAQTPESEVHGRLLLELAAARAGEPALVLVDGTGYRERLGGGAAAEARASEHRRSWDRVLREAGATPVHVDLEADEAGALALAAAERVRAQEVR